MRRTKRIKSYHVPFEIQIEIMKWLPVKSLIRFRSVSKPWKLLISSLKFNLDYTTHHVQRQHLLLRYTRPSLGFLVSIVDDETFPKHMFHVTTAETLGLEQLQVVGTSYSLLCFVGVLGNYYTPDHVVIWNPSIRKIVTIRMHNVKKRCSHYEYSFFGFGVCPNTLDPKIVKICTCECNVKVEVFTLSSRVWRSLSSNILLLKHVNFKDPYNNVVIDGFIYWFVFETRERINKIVSFDLTNEEFKEIQLSDELTLSIKSSWFNDMGSRICKLKESLVVVIRNFKASQEVYEVWKMEINGVKRSFAKLFNIEIRVPKDISVIKLCGFNKNGQLILETDNRGSSDLVAYEPYKKSIKNLVINGRIGSFIVTSYTESLLLLDN